MIWLCIEGLNGCSCENHVCEGIGQGYILVSLSGLLMHVITLIICYGNTVVCSKNRDNQIIKGIDVGKATGNQLHMPTNVVEFVAEPRPRTKLSNVRPVNLKFLWL